MGQHLNTSVELSKNSSIKVSSGFKLKVSEPRYHEKVYEPNLNLSNFTLESELVTSLPKEIDQKHVLVEGVAKKLSSVYLSIPEQNSEISVKINEKSSHKYRFELKNTGIKKKHFNDILDLILL